MAYAYIVWNDGVTLRKPEMPGTAKEHNRQETPRINANDRHLAQLTDQSLGTTTKTAQETSLITPSSTAAMKQPEWLQGDIGMLNLWVSKTVGK